MTAPSPASSAAHGPEAGVTRRTYLWWGLGLLGVVMAYAFSSYVTQLLGTIDRQHRHLSGALDSLRVVSAARDSAEKELLRARQAFRIMRDSRGEPLLLSGTPGSPRGSGGLAVSSSSGAVLLIVSGLPANGGRRYVLRSRSPAGYDSLAAFTVRDTSVHAYVFDFPGHLHGGFAVTAGDGATEVLTSAERGPNPRSAPGSASRKAHLP